MAPVCGIIPEYILQDIIQKRLAPQHVVNRCQSTIYKTKQLQDIRISHRQSIAAAQRQPTPQGIVPSYTLESLPQNAATEQQREAARRTFAHRAKHQTDTWPTRHLDHTVYDAQNSRDDPPPHDKVLIHEGGPLLSPEQDPTNNANECYIGLGKAYDFYFNFFKRDSIDNMGLKLEAYVHVGDLYNAFWDGSVFFFGGGDGIIFNSFTDKLDVIGHLFTEGVMQYTGRLRYPFQSGALTQSIADAFGIMIKQWGENPEFPQTVNQANWLIGEGMFISGINGRALRDMKNPGTAYDDPKVGKDSQVAHWKDFKTTSEDSGGVHINSGIPNRAFCLAANMIGGYAWEGAGPIWYSALTSGKLREDATFKEFADATIENAGAHVDKVKEAWKLVGYPFPEKRHEL
jgi:Zn-dependent metalloprotease